MFCILTQSCLIFQQMDNAVYTFEQLLHQSLENSADKEDLCKASQRIQDRVIKVRGSRGYKEVQRGQDHPMHSGQGSRGEGERGYRGMGGRDQCHPAHVFSHHWERCIEMKCVLND